MHPPPLSSIYLHSAPPTSTQLHLPPRSSTHLHSTPPTSTQLHPPPLSSVQLHPAHFSLHPAVCNTLNIIRTKISNVIGQFPEIQVEKIKVVHSYWKLAHMGSQGGWFWHLLCEFQTLIPHLGKFWLKKSKLSVLPENWHKWYLRGADSESGPGFLKFWPQNSFLGIFVLKKSKLSVLPENLHT